MLIAWTKATSHVCIEIPIDGISTSEIVSPNLSAPRSYSTLLLTPGVRFGSDELPFGFLPLNFFSIGLGAARYVSSTQLLDGRTAPSERATTFAVRVDGGLNVKLNQRLGIASRCLPRRRRLGSAGYSNWPWCPKVRVWERGLEDMACSTPVVSRERHYNPVAGRGFLREALPG